MEAVAKLNNYPTSPRKMRLLADLIRGEKVEKVLAILEHSTKHPATPLRKLVLSAISNWKQKNEGGNEDQLIIKTIMVDGARTLRRMRPAPQGRGYRIRKRSNHVTLIVDVKGTKVVAPVIIEGAEPAIAEAPKTVAAKKTVTKKTKKA
ncbi:MAG: 50S ribosomal protein L22 [Chitinophagaceae bacterium]|nr:MAG: 50S ribosomal protein L22 [Chitinophagaceae bacterium]